MKKNNHICVDYEIPKIPCAIHLSFVKEKRKMLIKKATFHPPTMLCYSCYQRLNNLLVISVINSKNIPYKILAIGNYSTEIFGRSVEVLILWELMSRSEMIF